MFLQKAWFCIAAFYFAVFVLVECAVITPREMDIRRAHQMNLKKRPFCNAFTGCGKKRSDPSATNHQNAEGQDEEVDNSLSDLIDLNSEPAVEDLMRQIMSQAKLWEAIQEASKEISSHKYGNGEHLNRYPVSFSSQ